MLSLCAGAETQKAPAAVAEEALQIKMVAGTGFEPVTFRLWAEEALQIKMVAGTGFEPVTFRL